MGLIYVSSESSELMNAMKANISTGKEVTNQLKSGSQKIISAVDGRTLSGAAYTAGKGLFSELIVPTIDKVTSAIDELETELTTYNTADSKVSDEGTLDEDRLRDKIATKKAMKQAVDISAAVVKGAFQDNTAAKILDSLLQVQCTLNKMSNAFETDIDELQKKLEKLQQFSSETSNLFSNSLSTMKAAMQAVTILSKTIVYPDGSYQLPPGIVSDWFKQLKKPDKAETSDKDKQPDVGNREYKLIDLGYGKIMMWVEKGKTSATPDDIDVTLKYNEWLSRMIDKHGISFIKGEHQEDFLELFLRQNITLLKEIETGIDSTTGKELTTQEKLLKMTTLANSMLTADVAIKGVIDVGKTSTSKSTIGKKKASRAKVLTLKSLSDEVASSIGGKASPLKNGYKVEIPNGRKPIVVRIMDEGSGGRGKPYYRVSIDGKGSLTPDCIISSDRGLTHIDLRENSMSEITNIINNYLGRK